MRPAAESSARLVGSVSAVARAALPRARAAALLAAAFAFSSPAIALACPQCAGRNDGNNVGRTILLGAFVFLPYFAVAAVWRFVKSNEAALPRPAGARAGAAAGGSIGVPAGADASPLARSGSFEIGAGSAPAAHDSGAHPLPSARSDAEPRT